MATDTYQEGNTMKEAKHTVTHPDGTTDTRRSARTYTHAIVSHTTADRARADYAKRIASLETRLANGDATGLTDVGRRNTVRDLEQTKAWRDAVTDAGEWSTLAWSQSAANAAKAARKWAEVGSRNGYTVTVVECERTGGEAAPTFGSDTLSLELDACTDHKAHHEVTDDLGRTYVVGINADGSTGYAHGLELDTEGVTEATDDLPAPGPAYSEAMAAEAAKRDERPAHYIEHAEELEAFRRSFDSDTPAGGHVTIHAEPGESAAARCEHVPHVGTIVDRNGAPCPRATFASYPLRAKCEWCKAPIICADGTAEWSHNVDEIAGLCELALAFDDLEAARAHAIELAGSDGQWVAVHERGCEPNGNLHYVVKAHGFTALDAIEIIDERVVAFVVGDEVTR